MRLAGADRHIVVAALNSRYFLWLALAAPAAIQTARYSSGALFYGEYLHWSGLVATELLIATLAISALSRGFPAARWVRWLMRRRRYLGVATFGYSVLHALAYLERAAAPGAILDEALTAGIGTGWVALVILLLLAGTSNDASVRRLGRRWKWLHRGVYLAAPLIFAHWILTAFDPLLGVLHLAVLSLLLGYRLLKGRRRAGT